MVRILSLALLAVALLVPATSSQAALSRNNPYSSFNISGVNYGAQQWQQSHRGAATRYHCTTSYRRR